MKTWLVMLLLIILVIAPARATEKHHEKEPPTHEPKPDPKPERPGPPASGPAIERDIGGSAWWVTWASYVVAGPFLSRRACQEMADRFNQGRRRYVCLTFAD